MKNYPKLCISSTLKPQGGIYRHQGNRGPGDKPWPKTRSRPRPYDRENAVQAAFPRPYWETRPYWGRARGASSRVRSRLSPIRPCTRFLICSPWF